MAGIKVTDIAFGRLRSPDLDLAEQFLTDFGLVKVERTANALYMRGSDPAHHIHVTEKGDPKFLGMAFYAASADDLKALAKVPGASGVENIDEPGGGKRVRLTEPNGYTIEVVHGIQELPEIKLERQPTNSAAEPLRRAGRLMRPSKGPTTVKRIAHGVMGSPEIAKTVHWFRENLGMIQSDDIYVGPKDNKDNLVGSFNRCDRGDEYVDHHTFFCQKTPRAGLNHFSFEVADIDAVFIDHAYLQKCARYQHVWGIGRHQLGSQVFDYWSDPWGRVHEHWADSDRLNASSGSNFCTPEDAAGPWGEPPTELMRNSLSA
jgi:catechol 2,3-dioxygenase-like lactoylglutathione lyase family enzyme